MAKSTKSAARFTADRTDLWLLVNHDFRQPSQTISLLAASLANATTDAARRTLADRIGLMSAELEAMSEAMDLISNLDTGLQSAIATRGSLSAMLSETMADLAPIALNCGRQLDAGDCDHGVVVDPVLLRRIVHGMVLGAIKLSRSRDIVVRCRETTTRIAFDVTYLGTDPNTAVLRRAFVELPPLPSAPTRPILGLGLALVTRLADHARVTLVTSQDGEARHCLSLRIRKPVNASKQADTPT